MISSIVHERMLVGAIDSFLGTVVCTALYLAEEYRDQLERVAERWLTAGGQNEVDQIQPDWIDFYLQTVEDPITAEIALRDFYRWALREHLVERVPFNVV